MNLNMGSVILFQECTTATLPTHVCASQLLSQLHAITSRDGSYHSLSSLHDCSSSLEAMIPKPVTENNPRPRCRMAAKTVKVQELRVSRLTYDSNWQLSNQTNRETCWQNCKACVNDIGIRSAGYDWFYLRYWNCWTLHYRNDTSIILNRNSCE